ncbi:MAG: IS982 family transposase, partial [Tannerella sp.]|nr:IS982 family transposase [Tannerella sp.]
MTDEFCKKFNEEVKTLHKLPEHGIRHRNRSCEMSESEIITILMMYHFGNFKNFKHYYLHFIRVHLQKD